MLMFITPFCDNGFANLIYQPEPTPKIIEGGFHMFAKDFFNEPFDR